MAVDFPKFFATAAELYNLWPSLFNWGLATLGGLFSAVIWLVWFIRGLKAKIDLANLCTAARF